MTRLLQGAIIGLIAVALLDGSTSASTVSQVANRVNIAEVRQERDRARLYADRLELVVRRLATRAERNERRLRAERRRTRLRFYVGVTHAMRLASVSFGVSYSQLHAVGSCESGLYPFARNGQYRGVFQEGPMFEAGPFGRAGFSVWDVYANVFTAAYTVARQGWRQWECKP